MKNLLQPKLRKPEQKVASVIALPIALVLIILFYILKLLTKFLIKFKKWLFRASVMIFVMYGLVSFFIQVADAPKAKAELIVKEKAPLSERERNINLIKRYFGKDADDAIRVFTCESGLRTEAINPNNKDGNPDVGIAQIHVYPSDPFTIEDMKNPYANLAEAKHKFDNRGWQPWVSSYKCHQID